MDETSVSIRGELHYLYRAVDQNGKSVGSMLCSERTMQSARAFLRKTVETPGAGWPRKINLDGYTASHRALRLLGQEDERWRSVSVRNCRYLNNVVEQDHRAIKRRCASMLGFKSLRTAAVTLSGIELAHRIRKRQFWLDFRSPGESRTACSLKHVWDLALYPERATRSYAADHRPSVHQNSRPLGLPTPRVPGDKPRRYHARYSWAVAFTCTSCPTAGSIGDTNTATGGRKRLFSWVPIPTCQGRVRRRDTAWRGAC